jgi:hypothetical protein
MITMFAMYICIFNESTVVHTFPFSILTCKELRTAKIYWKMTVDLFTANTPNIQVIPRSGNSITAALRLSLKEICGETDRQKFKCLR